MPPRSGRHVSTRRGQLYAIWEQVWACSHLVHHLRRHYPSQNTVHQVSMHENTYVSRLEKKPCAMLRVAGTPSECTMHKKMAAQQEAVCPGCLYVFCSALLRSKLTSIFLMTLRRDDPYRTPYFPVIPTFFVRLPCTIPK